MSFEELRRLRLKHDLSIKKFCEMIELSRSTYYRWRKRSQQDNCTQEPVDRTRIPSCVREEAIELAKQYICYDYRKIWGSVAPRGAQRRR